jgi:hypothetical protein
MIQVFFSEFDCAPLSRIVFGCTFARRPGRFDRFMRKSSSVSGGWYTVETAVLVSSRIESISAYVINEKSRMLSQPDGGSFEVVTGPYMPPSPYFDRASSNSSAEWKGPSRTGGACSLSHVQSVTSRAVGMCVP